MVEGEKGGGGGLIPPFLLPDLTPFPFLSSCILKAGRVGG